MCRHIVKNSVQCCKQLGTYLSTFSSRNNSCVLLSVHFICTYLFIKLFLRPGFRGGQPGLRPRGLHKCLFANIVGYKTGNIPGASGCFEGDFSGVASFCVRSTLFLVIIGASESVVGVSVHI